MIRIRRNPAPTPYPHGDGTAVHWLRQGNFMRNAINNLEFSFLDEEILEKWVGVNSMQVSALGRPKVSASGPH